MDNQRRWIALDTFKLIVALVLLALILILALQKPSGTPTTNASQGSQVGVIAPTQTSLSPTITTALSTPTLTLPPTQTAAVVLPTATTASQPTPTPTTVPPTPTPTIVPPTPTLASAAQVAPTATPQPQAAAVDCPLAQPSRLAVGKQALVTSNLNLRKDAGIDKQITRVFLPNSKVEIIGGPVCTPYQNGAYLWWNVKSEDGATGWSAEASLSKGFYFLKPVP